MIKNIGNVFMPAIAVLVDRNGPLSVESSAYLSARRFSSASLIEMSSDLKFVLVSGRGVTCTLK